MSLKNFQLISKLGEGAYSSVYKVKRIEDEQDYALKKVKLGDLSDKEKQNALNEVRILASVRNQNIIGYKEVFLNENTNSLCIIMEYADNGDLYEKITIHQQQKSFMDEKEVWSIFIQIVKGLKGLHDLNIFHRDLKSANVFLNQNGECKLGDMNVSKVAKKGMLYTQTGTPYYASPEVWKDQPYDSKSDIWSLGCVLYEMLSLKPPFRAEDMEGLYKKVINGQYPKLPSHFSQDIDQMVKYLLQVNPQSRPNCDKILSLPIVQKHIDDLTLLVADEEINKLMQTIRIPKNLNILTQRLPEANYTPLKVKKMDKYMYNTVMDVDHQNNVSKDIKSSRYRSQEKSSSSKLRGLASQKKKSQIILNEIGQQIDLDQIKCNNQKYENEQKLLYEQKQQKLNDIYGVKIVNIKGKINSNVRSKSKRILPVISKQRDNQELSILPALPSKNDKGQNYIQKVDNFDYSISPIRIHENYDKYNGLRKNNDRSNYHIQQNYQNNISQLSSNKNQSRIKSNQRNNLPPINLDMILKIHNMPKQEIF